MTQRGHVYKLNLKTAFTLASFFVSSYLDSLTV